MPAERQRIEASNAAMPPTREADTQSNKQRYAHALLLKTYFVDQRPIDIRETAPLPSISGIDPTAVPTFDELAGYLDKLFDAPQKDATWRCASVQLQAGRKAVLIATFDLHSDIQRIRLAPAQHAHSLYPSPEYREFLNTPRMKRLAASTTDRGVSISIAEFQNRYRQVLRSLGVRTSAKILGLTVIAAAMLWAFDQQWLSVLATTIVLVSLAMVAFVVACKAERSFGRCGGLSCPMCGTSLANEWRARNRPSSPLHDAGNPFVSGVCRWCFIPIIDMDDCEQNSDCPSPPEVR